LTYSVFDFPFYITPNSFINISLDKLAVSHELAFIILFVWASKNNCENTENCVSKSITCGFVGVAFEIHLQYLLSLITS